MVVERTERISGVETAGRSGRSDGDTHHHNSSLRPSVGQMNSGITVTRQNYILPFSALKTIRFAHAMFN